MQTRSFVILVLLSLSLSLSSKGQSDEVGSGRALSFDGIDDYIDFGNIYDNLNLPISISAWVYMDSNVTTYPIFNSQDNLPIYNGITFIVSPNSIGISYGDGKGENNPAFRRGKAANVNSDLSNRWVHVAANIRSALDMDIFVNGIDVNGSYVGDSDLPMDSNSPNDVAKIGYWHSNGLTLLFKGKMDEVRLWKRSLTLTEVRESMCKKLTGSETNLIGYWAFNEISGDVIVDKSINHFDGHLKGGVARIYSGAPIGDDSEFLYTNNWAGVTVSMLNTLEKIDVYGVTNNPEGIQIYNVNSLPSQTAGIDLTNVSDFYFGVFVAALDTDNAMDISYNYGDIEACKLMTRGDNSISLWGDRSSPLFDVAERIELVSIPGTKDIQLDLGPDKIFCDKAEYTISPIVDPAEKNFLWSTGVTTQTIDVVSSGEYYLKVFDGCSAKSDSIRIDFYSSPPKFSLGDDGLFCKNQIRVLDPHVANKMNPYFTWQDGSITPTFQVEKQGVYWLQIKNYCGTSVDSITLKPNPDIQLDLGPDIVLCDKSKYTISAIINTPGKNFLWNTGATSNAIDVVSSGEYYVKVFDGCSSERDTIKIDFNISPPKFSLDEDAVVCPNEARILKPHVDNQWEVYFIWQNGSTTPTFLVEESGVYWLQIKNYCGTSMDSIDIIKPDQKNLFIPNVFTPNGDTYNEKFEIDNRLEHSEVLIYNRWGGLVYKSKDYLNDWDGENVMSGVYYYVIKGQCITEKKGSVSVLR